MPLNHPSKGTNIHQTLIAGVLRQRRRIGQDPQSHDWGLRETNCAVWRRRLWKNISIG